MCETKGARRATGVTHTDGFIARTFLLVFAHQSFGLFLTVDDVRSRYVIYPKRTCITEVLNQDSPLVIGNAIDVIVLPVTNKPGGVVFAIFDVDGFQLLMIGAIEPFGDRRNEAT